MTKNRGRDLLVTHEVLVAQRLEGPELVERVQGLAHGVLGEAVLLGSNTFCLDDAGHRRVLGEALRFHQQLQRREASPARNDGIPAGLRPGLVEHGPHVQRLQEAAAADVLGELADAHPRLDAAHVGARGQQLVERQRLRGYERDLAHDASP